MKRREIEDVLEPEEKLVWEGRPVGYRRPRGWILALYVFFVGALVALPVSLVGELLLLAHASSSTVVTTYKVSFYAINVTVTGTGGGSFFGTGSVPGPVILGFIAAVIAYAELERLANERKRRYGITDRRLLALDHKGRLTAAPRGTHEPTFEKGVLVSGPVRFEGIADPEAARSAL